jgi:hypothetical protein
MVGTGPIICEVLTGNITVSSTVVVWFEDVFSFADHVKLNGRMVAELTGRSNVLMKLFAPLPEGAEEYCKVSGVAKV